MKKIISLLLALSVLLTTEYALSLTAYADSALSPIIALEISDYRSSGEISERVAGAQTSATAGEIIALTFILSGVESIEYYQLSGSYDMSYLSAGYYDVNAEWVTGDEDQDFRTIIRGSRDYTDSKLEDGFSYTRTLEEPSICILGFSPDGAVQIEPHTRLVTVGFEVLDDIDNIYDAFEWDSNTMVGSSTDDYEFTLANGLVIGCEHSFESTVVPATCGEQGYTQYTCTICGIGYKADYTPETDLHSYVFDSKDSDGTFYYGCANCDTITALSREELLIMWKAEYINHPPTSSNDSIFLDLHPDNIINAKDYSILIN